MTTVGCLDLFKVSFASELKSLFAQHVHWSSWINHEFSLLWQMWWGCRHYPCSNKTVKKVALSDFLSLYKILARFHATLEAHRSCCKVSSCDLSAKFGAQGLRSWCSHFWIIPNDGPFLSLFCVVPGAYARTESCACFPIGLLSVE